jgi:membrane protein YqaA with SNARE-associated domain
LRFSRFIAHSRLAVWFLGLFSFAESIILPLPTDLILIPLVLLRRRRWLLYALVATITSILGGIAAYFIGKFFFDVFAERIFEVYQFQDEFVRVQELFQESTFFTMLISAFTFIPYKVFTISGGFFEVNFFSFIAASLIGRTFRFVGEAYIMYRFGPVIGKAIYRWFSVVVVAIIIIAALIVFFIVR